MEKTFTEFDKFGLKEFADDLTQYLLVESRFYDDSYVLSLNGGFGCGKTTFLKMWQTDLKAKDSKEFHVISINAWKSDYLGDPLLTIVSHLLQELPQDKTKKHVKSIKKTAGSLCRMATYLGNDVVKNKLGVDLAGALQYAESKENKSDEGLGNACFEAYREREKLFHQLKNEFGKLADSIEQPILIIVDELDRCKPNYAIEFLETIKHFFDIQGLVFVLAVDKAQLSASARALFGQDLDFDEYYRKFAQRNVELPVKSKEMTNKFCQGIVNDYLSPVAYEKKGLFPNAKYEQDRIEAIAILCVALSLNARQIHEFMRIAAHILSRTNKADGTLLLGWHLGVFFMSAISIKEPAMYHKIGKNIITPSEFTEFFKSLNLLDEYDRYGEWWPPLLYVGVFGNNQEIIEAEFQKLGIWKPSNHEKDANLKEFTRHIKSLSSYGYTPNNIFSSIYDKLEGLKTFEK